MLVAKVRILGMVPDRDMNAIASSAVFQSDSWSAFSFDKVHMYLGAQKRMYQSPPTPCLVGGRRQVETEFLFSYPSFRL